jgi:hypothetical protein
VLAAFVESCAAFMSPQVAASLLRVLKKHGPRVSVATVPILVVLCGSGIAATGCKDRSHKDDRPASRIARQPFLHGQRPSAFITQFFIRITRRPRPVIRGIASGRNPTGDRALLWLSPTVGRSFCMALEVGRRRLSRSAAGTCGNASSSPPLVPLISIPGPIRTSRLLRGTVFVAGAVTDEAAASVDIRFADGAIGHPPLTLVSGLPFRASFFVYVVPRSHLRRGPSLRELAVRDRQGRVLAESRF